MSLLRQKAQRRTEEASRTRRDWSPNDSSPHYRIYRWWRRKSGKYIAKENFCHYWRVVLIWAPLRFFGLPLLYALGFLGVLVVIALVVWLIMTFTPTVLAVLGVIAGLFLVVAYITYCVGVGEHLVYVYEPPLLDALRDGERWDWLAKRRPFVRWLAIVLASPLLLLFGVVCYVFIAVVLTGFYFHEKYDLYGRVGRWFMTGQPRIKGLRWIRPWYVVPASLLVLAIWFDVARVILAIVGVVALLVGTLIGVAYIADVVKEEQLKREKKRAQAVHRRQMATMDVFFRQLFILLNPEQVDDDSAFLAWLADYARQIQAGFGGLGIYAIQRSWHVEHFGLAEAYHARYPQPLENVVAEQGHGIVAVRMRQAVDDMFDMLVFIWTVVKTKKWQLCPLVKLPE